jgi:hypothetical protein
MSKGLGLTATGNAGMGSGRGRSTRADWGSFRIEGSKTGFGRSRRGTPRPPPDEPSG